MRHVTDRKGYVIVEAAIFLPVFVLAVVSIMYYINVFSIMEGVSYSAVEETARLASKASVVKTAPGFTSTLKSRVKTDNPGAENPAVERFRYLYWDGDMGNMISVDLDYDVNLQLPMGFDHRFRLTSRVKCRGFTGSKTTGDPMSFDEMESEGIWEPVWIFPMSGEKYHSSSCTYVKANAREMVLTAALKRRYGPCSLCGAAEAATGSYVYCFAENGTVYHRDSCRQVQRYALEINKKDAIDKGYTPCSKCGGG